MEQIYNNKMSRLGYDQLVCDIFLNWEDVKDEILLPERKSGSGNGTIHVFLGAADNALRNEFPSYYESVQNGEDPSEGAIEVKHYFVPSNIISMLGHVCKYYHDSAKQYESIIDSILKNLSDSFDEGGLLSTTSLLKLSVGSNRLRPYFKQFDGNGVFSKVVRQVLLPQSAYKISLYKNAEGDYAAFWLIGFNDISNFDADSNSSHFSKVKVENGEDINLHDSYNQYLTAIRTKPFLLLAGISGTGKSRIVRELAFKSCPKYLQDKDGTTPGNYCMIEVKPNWHDSTELLGYYSNLSKGYQFKKFVKFLIKAKMFPNVPFFVCLDEMNLAPVEQYFAEILSILETRKVVVGEDGNKSVKTGAIIDPEHFKSLGKIGGFAQNFTDRDIYMKLHDIATESIIADEVGKRTDLSTEGLTLPDNVIIIGTVNMDDTTHQFSRKVIDRAMTIEMNGGKLKNMFGGSNNLTYLEEEEQKKWQAAFKQEYVSADEVLVAHPNEANDIVQLLPEKLDAINAALKGTPFEVSYRVLNELTIMVGVMLDDTPDEELEKIVDKAIDRILLMKILPRIEGDSDMFNLKTAQTVGSVTCRNRLEWLRELAPNINYSEEDGKDHQQTAKEKIEEMIERLENQEFTRFWP